MDSSAAEQLAKASSSGNSCGGFQFDDGMDDNELLSAYEAAEASGQLQPPHKACGV